MSSLQLKRARSAQNPQLRRRLILVAAVIGALAVALGITLYVLIQNNQRLSQGRAQIESGILSDLTMIVRTYDAMKEPKADIAGQVLPEISKHIYSAYSQDNVLMDLHGKGASILGNELYTKINGAIETMERQIKADRIIDATSNELTQYVAQIQRILEARMGQGNSMTWLGGAGV